MSTLSDRISGKVFTRRDIGLPTTPGGTFRNLSSVTEWFSHWTTGRALGRSDTRQWVYNIWRYHTETRGWADIGYNYLVDIFGNIFEGRGRYRVGAHAAGHNTPSLGVALLAGVDDPLTDDAKLAIRALWDWGQESMPLGRRRGHRDVGSTSCPGPELYKWTIDGMPLPQVIPPKHEEKTQDFTRDMPTLVRIGRENPVFERKNGSIFHIPDPQTAVEGYGKNWKDKVQSMDDFRLYRLRRDGVTQNTAYAVFTWGEMEYQASVSNPATAEALAGDDWQDKVVRVSEFPGSS